MASYKDWLQKDQLILIEGWSRAGLSQQQIAHNIGCGHSTFRMWLKKYKPIREAAKKGKEVTDFEVENALYAKAMKGDTTAMIFWLKNRKPNEWRNFIEKPTDQDKEEQRARIERMVLENEKLRAEIEKLRQETGQDGQPDDGFLAALAGSAAVDWGNGDETPE